MLYTAHISATKDFQKKMKTYNILEIDAVSPDKSDLDFYKKGYLTWSGFELTYSTNKITRPEAHQWMDQVAKESINEDIVLVDDFESFDKSCRRLLAHMIKSLYSGHMNIKYAGEL